MRAYILSRFFLKLNRLKTVFLLFNLILLNSFLFSQQIEVLNSGGGYHENSVGSISFSIGDLMIETLAHGDLYLTQGFCQSNFEISTVGERANLKYELSTYPNPVKDFILLKIKRGKLINLKYLLYNINGRLLEMNDINSIETRISFHQYFPSTYFLKIIEDNIEVKTFKIIKLK